MKKQTRIILIVAAVAVAGYLGWRWWQNRQQGGGTGQLGTNLNSIAPALVAGSTGPQSGLNYYAGSTTVYFSEPITQTAKGGGRTNNVTHVPDTWRTHPLIPPR
jgi:hypothetical protein